MLFIRTFGGCRVERDGHRLDELSRQRKTLAFLALLAGAGARGMTRESVTAYLWSEDDEERGRTSLKQLVHSLRRQLQLSDLLLPSAELRLNPQHVVSDVVAFRDAVRRDDHEAAVGLYLGPFLNGFHVRRADGFEQWASDERASLARDYARSLEAVAERADRDGSLGAAVEGWRRLVVVEPLNARATIGLMRALAAAGDQAGALQHARTFQTLVHEELGVAADPAVAHVASELMRRVPNEGLQAQTPTEVANVGKSSREEPPPLPALAVLPFANTSGDAADEPFSDGLTDELIGTIGKIGGLVVTGRTSSFSFKGKELDARTIAELLRVAHVLEGSVRRSGSRLKIGAQLVRAADGTVVWSEIYDRDAKDIFAVQEDIAQAIASALRIRLTQARPSRRPATQDLVAHELYLKGRYFQNRVSEDDLKRSAEYFEQAIARDASYAQAYAGLADAYLLLAILGNGPQDYYVSRVREAVAHALTLDGTLAEAHTSLASVLFGFDWNWPAAGREFERAISLDAAYGFAHQRYGLFLMYQGRVGEALPVLERARSVDPFAPSANMNLGRLHLVAGRAEAAVPLLQTAIELNPQLALAHEHLGHGYLRLERHGEALNAFRAVARLAGDRGAARLAYALAVTGRVDEAREVVNQLLRATEHDHPPSFGLAMAFAGLGDASTAFAWLDRAYAERDPFLHTIKATVAFETLRSHPQWPRLLRRMGLSP